MTGFWGLHRGGNLTAFLSHQVFFPLQRYRINLSQVLKTVYKASCWDCQDFYIGKTKRRLHEKLNIFKRSRVPVAYLLLQTTSCQLVVT